LTISQNPPFNQLDMQRAAERWGANCGPAALAFACGIHIDAVRGIIPGFDEKGYTNPTMMKKALETLGADFADYSLLPDIGHIFSQRPCLVRVQWTGPWTAPGANGKWAYRHTHWIVTWREAYDLVYDCNGGVRLFDSWKKEIVPALLADVPRADGGFHPTHVWRIAERTPNGPSNSMPG
jgi:hypothetical protein